MRGPVRSGRSTGQSGIRTYNFPENRIADHRTGYKAYNLDTVLGGELDPVVRSAIEADEAARLHPRGAVIPSRCVRVSRRHDDGRGGRKRVCRAGCRADARRRGCALPRVPTRAHWRRSPWMSIGELERQLLLRSPADEAFVTGTPDSSRSEPSGCPGT